MNVLSISSVIGMSLLGGTFGDFYRERAAVLITSAEMNQVDHGYIEMFYPESLFWHHKINKIRPGDGDAVMGFLSLSEKTWDVDKVQLSFSGSSESPGYQISKGQLSALLKSVIPSHYHPFGPSGAIEKMDVKAGLDLRAGEMFVPMLEGKWVEEAKNPATPGEKPKRNLTFPASKMAYLVHIGPRPKIQEKYDLYKKGTEGDKQSGIGIHSSMYRKRALTFQVSPSSPSGEDPAQAASQTAQVKGWFVERHYLQPFGHLVLPVIYSEKRSGGSAESIRRSSIEFPAPLVSMDDKFNVTEFTMDAAAFIQNIFLPKVKPGGMGEPSSFECHVNPSHPEDSACRVEPVPGAGEKTQSTIRIKFEGPENEKQRAQNTFYLWDAKAQGDYYTVTVLNNPEPISISNKNVTPVRIRAAEGKKEDLK